MWRLQTKIEKSFSNSTLYSYSNLKSPRLLKQAGFVGFVRWLLLHKYYKDMRPGQLGWKNGS